MTLPRLITPRPAPSVGPLSLGYLSLHIRDYSVYDMTEVFQVVSDGIENLFRIR